MGEKGDKKISIQIIRKITALVVVFLILSSIAISFYIYKDYKKIYNEEAVISFQSEASLINKIINEFQNEALGVALTLSKMEQVQEAYDTKDSLEAISILNRTTQPLVNDIKEQLGFSKYKVHFHKAPAQSFLREWNQTGGDDLSGFRNTILHVYEKKEALKCIELGRGGFALRGIAPISNINGDFVGSVEVFFEIQDIFPFLKSEFKDYQFIVLAKKDNIDRLFFNQEKKEYYKGQLGKSIILENTLSDEHSISLNDLNKKGFFGDYESSNHLLINPYGKYMIGCVTIHDFSSQDIGKIVFVYDRTPILQKAGKQLFGIISMILGMGTLLIFLILLLVRRLIAYFERNNNTLRETLDVKNKFFKIIAHDLKSPFNTLIGFSNLLLTEKEIPEYRKDTFIELISEISKKGMGLLENLLLWSKSQTNEINLRIERLNLKSSSEEALELLKMTALNKNITIKNQLTEDTYVMADPNAINTILRNLVSNSIKFTNRGGHILLTSKVTNGHAVINVIDNGIGMDKTTTQNLFSTNNITSNQGTEEEKGTGLGLMLVKDFVERQDGKIKVSSEFGKGSTFTFTLPVSSSTLSKK